MKKFKVLAVIAAVCLVAAIFAVPALAKTGKQSAELAYRDIKITLDGSTLTPRDANGTVVEPFIIDGTTYLPLRAVAEALGLDVQWDSATSTVILSSSSAPSSPSSPSTPSSTQISEGTYIVGTDIPAGTYKLTCTNDFGAYWERCSDASGEFDSIIANEAFYATAYVTVNNGEYLTITGCTGVLQ